MTQNIMTCRLRKCAYLVVSWFTLYIILVFLTFKDIDKKFIYRTVFLMLPLACIFTAFIYTAAQKFHEFYIKEFVSFNATGWFRIFESFDITQLKISLYHAILFLSKKAIRRKKYS